jgi:ergothioneine biosynthesis protein EgtB
MQHRVDTGDEPVLPTPAGVECAPALAERYCAVRVATEALADPLAPDDQSVQSMPDASPTKWHLGHTTWFFERVVLKTVRPDYSELNAGYGFLYNSYYEAFGPRLSRDKRGLASRPTLAEVLEYRRHVDANILALLLAQEPVAARTRELVIIGLNHEQQHQELILTDIKHALAANPLRPRYSRPGADVLLPTASDRGSRLGWHAYPTTIAEIGAAEGDFAFDNERPRHKALVHAFAIANRLVTCGEFIAFMGDGGYHRPELWLADGWATALAEGWQAPLYWERRDDAYWHMTLAGMRPVTEAEPLCHVSYYEADAYARWAGSRLPTELEWEVAAAGAPLAGNFAENGALHPLPLAANDDRDEHRGPRQMFGDVWEWTASPYVAYPGFRPWSGPLGEYNAKFMANQFVLRGGSCATPRSHIRATYRNFFPPQARWQFGGLRLARS